VPDDAALRHLSTRTELDLTLTLHWAVTNAECALVRLERARELGCDRDAPRPLLFGRDLSTIGIPAGREMGRLLERAYALQLDGEVATREEALRAVRDLIS
jgi:hypothetical protein